MQESKFIALTESIKPVSPLFKDISESNDKWIQEQDDLPEGVTGPSAERMKEIKDWFDAYKKKYPRDSNRAARRATQRHFNLILKK